VGGLTVGASVSVMIMIGHIVLRSRLSARGLGKAVMHQKWVLLVAILTIEAARKIGYKSPQSNLAARPRGRDIPCPAHILWTSFVFTLQCIVSSRCPGR
jgi:hypothetical protein